MTDKIITLSEADYVMLRKLLVTMKQNHRLKAPHLVQFYEEVENAQVIREDMLPYDRVTFNSQVNYTNLRDGSRHKAVIVFPTERDESQHKYSILTPLGTSLLGEKVHTETTCYAPGGDIPLRIESIFRPDGRTID